MAEQEKSATPASDTAAAVENPQIDTEKVTLEQLEQLFESGTAELPTVSGEAGEKPEAKAEPTEEKPPVKPADETPPAKPEGEGDGEPTGEVVEETRTPEEIAQAQQAARERVESEGGDQAAQDAAAEEAAQPQPKAEVEEPPAKPEPDDEEEIGSRQRLKDPIDRAIAAVYRARKGTANEISWAEAESLVKGDKAEKIEEVVVDLNKVVTDLEAEVTTIKQQLDEAGANEGVFDKAISKLAQDFAEKTADLKLAKRDLRDQTAAAAQADADARKASETARVEARTRAIEAFPAAADETTPLGAAIAKRIRELQNPRHKNHSVLYADDAPYIVVRDVAEELGIQPVVKKKTAAKPPVTPPATPPATPPKSKLSPASGAKTSVPVAQPQVDAKKELDRLLKDPNASLEELDAVFEPGGPAKTLAAVTA